MTERNQKMTEKPKSQSVRRKNRYGAAFFYTFCGAFVVVGIIAIAIFLGTQDHNIFDFSSRQLYEEARQYILVGDYDNAEKSLKKCIKKNATNTDAVLLLADLYDGQSRQDDAINMILDCIDESEKNARNDQLYKRIIQLYVSKGDISAAIDFSNGLSSYIKTRLSKVRPADLKVTPAGGEYESSVNATIKYAEGCTVYYTIDGSTPSSSSSVYGEEPILLPVGNITLKAVAVNPANNLVSELFEGTYTIKGDLNPYQFADAKVEQIVRSTIGKSSGTVYYKDLARVKKFDNSVGGDGLITTFEDLKMMTGITEIVLNSETKVADFDVFGSLPSLRRVTLTNCNLNNGDASKLFSACPNLTYLDISGNNLSDISSIVALRSISTLDISGNAIEDAAPIGELTSLTSLNIAANKISTVKWCSSLTSLTSLTVGGNDITDYSPISVLGSLKTLSLNYAGISDVGFISSLKNLETLDLKSNSISSVSALTSLSSLETINVSGNAYIEDLGALKNCGSLNVVTCSNITSEQEQELISANITVVRN